jgi:hypothetical protein
LFFLQCPWPFNKYSQEEVTIREGAEDKEHRKRKREATDEADKAGDLPQRQKKGKTLETHLGDLEEVLFRFQ